MAGLKRVKFIKRLLSEAYGYLEKLARDVASFSAENTSSSRIKMERIQVNEADSLYLLNTETPPL